MTKVPDDITLLELCAKAADALARAGLHHRIDIYRDVEIDDPAVRMMLGRRHRLRVRVKITAASLLFEGEDGAAEPEPAAGSPVTPANASVSASQPVQAASVPRRPVAGERPDIASARRVRASESAAAGASRPSATPAGTSAARRTTRRNPQEA